MALRGQASVSTTAFTNTVAVTVSGIGIQLNDLILWAVNAQSTNTFTPPAGWALVPGWTDINIGGGNSTATLYYKFATATEVAASTLTMTISTNEPASASIAVFSGRSLSTPFTALAQTPSFATSTAPFTFATTGVTAAANDDIAVFQFLTGFGRTSQVMTYTPPNGYINADCPNPTSNSSPSIAYCDKINVSAGATGTLGGTLNNSQGVTSAYYACAVVSLAQIIIPYTPVNQLDCSAASANQFSASNATPFLSTQTNFGPNNTLTLTAGNYLFLTIKTNSITDTALGAFTDSLGNSYPYVVNSGSGFGAGFSAFSGPILIGGSGAVFTFRPAVGHGVSVNGMYAAQYSGLGTAILGSIGNFQNSPSPGQVTSGAITVSQTAYLWGFTEDVSAFGSTVSITSQSPATQATGVWATFSTNAPAGTIPMAWGQMQQISVGSTAALWNTGTPQQYDVFYTVAIAVGLPSTALLLGQICL